MQNLVEADEVFSGFDDSTSQSRWKKDFLNAGFVHFSQALTPYGLQYLRNRVNDLLKNARRVDFQMTQTNNTPRRMFVVNGAVMNAQKDIMALYKSNLLFRALKEITDSDVVECDEKIEHVIISSLKKREDTHGWHLDDFPYAFIMALDVPVQHIGGVLEMKSKDQKIHQVFLESGDCYLMRTDELLHRVSPIKQDSTRTILNFTYSIRGKHINPNGTAQKLLLEN